MRWPISLALALLASNASIRANAYECTVIKLPRGHVVLYAKPSAASPVVAKLQDPQLMTLDDNDEASEWIHVTIEGKENLKGWVKGNRLHQTHCG